MSTQSMNMKIVHPQAAGIDVGSRQHFVAIGQGEEQVKSFGVFAQDLKEISQWLKEHKITTVALESTGSYWQNLFTELLESGFEVVLCNGRFTKHVSRKKTDVLDCQMLWAT